jgi:hypothetical protein
MSYGTPAHSGTVFIAARAPVAGLLGLGLMAQRLVRRRFRKG